MLPKTPLPDSAFEKTWWKMEEIEPLTPQKSNCGGNCKCNCLKTEDVIESYKEAAKSDAFLFGEYDGYEAYREDS